MRPNILIVMTDHQRGDTVLPHAPVIAPHARRLAAQGVAFTQAFCPSPHCCPARATFMTGLYPSRHGVWNNVCNAQALARGPKPGVRLWSEDLGAAGYNLAWSGKWHVSSVETPAQRGWRELLVSSTQPAEHGPNWEHWQRLAEQGEPTERPEGLMLRPGWGPVRLYGTAPEDSHGHDQRAVDRAVAALPELARAGRPWGLYVGLVGPHDPYVVPQRYLDMYRLEDIQLPANARDDFHDKPRVYARMRRQAWGQLPERELREGIRHYRAYCTYLDDLLGRVLSALDATGQADHTLVLFCSDHGDYCGEHGLFAKGIPCFRGAYHVPAIVRWPAGVRDPGRQVDQFVSLADFAPTFLDAAGVAAERTFTGASLVPFLRGEAPAAWRDEMWTQCNGVELYYTQRSVFTRQYKYVYNGFDEDELYDLRADPDELVNRAADPALAGVKREMVGRMWRFARREDDSAVNSYITVGLAPWGPMEAFT